MSAPTSQNPTNQIPVELSEDQITNSFAQHVMAGLPARTVYEVLIVGMLSLFGLPAPACMKAPMNDLVKVLHTIVSMYRRRQNMFPYTLSAQNFYMFTAMLISSHRSLFAVVNPSTAKVQCDYYAQTANESIRSKNYCGWAFVAG
jgi:hypothetical protein